MSAETSSCRLGTSILLTMAVTAFVLLAGHAPLQAQTYSEFYHFTSQDGAPLTSTLLMDRSGKFYGTTEYGQYGTCGWAGMVYQLKPSGSSWVLNPLHCFSAPVGGDDGALPLDYGGLAFGPDGNIYGTTNEGGISGGTDSFGTVFKVRPPPSACPTALCPWDSSILYEFTTNNPDGSFPEGNVVFDPAGNMYGTTEFGGRGAGGVFEMTPSGNGGWTETLIYSFTNGAEPQSGVVLDAAGNLYGTLPYGGLSYGYVYQLSRTQSGWVENILYRFTGGADGEYPEAGVVFDSAGNLYGATYRGGSGGGGTIFQLSPSGGGWNFNLLFSLPGYGGPQSSLTLDSAGNLYGTTYIDGRHQLGNIFELSPSGGGWNYTDLHSYAFGDDASNPIAGVTIGPDGTLYGTAGMAAWKITR